MVTGLLVVELHLPAANSLKSKRQVVKSLKDRLGNRYNISVAEVDHLDKWQRATLAIAIVSSDQKVLEAQIETIKSFIEQEIIGSGYITASEFTLL
ncbi:MAG: DUF503 domain-containing protein [Candidatus Marinimicrobia bacterium]|nr:DUF503 domain-containing protein [Candidatus Neomarinimicrobiota bacterium]